MQEFLQQVIRNLQNTSLLEFIGVIAGIISVYFSRKENIWVYPTGLVNTIIYIYICFAYELPGEAIVNLFYTVMSIYGWWMWSRTDQLHRPILKIRFSTRKEWILQLAFFLVLFATLFFAITWLRSKFPGVIPLPDAFATAAAFTGMLLMTRKKVESWWWWIITNMASVPLFYVKGLAFSSIYYVVLFVMAIAGLIEWQRRARATANAATFAVEK